MILWRKNKEWLLMQILHLGLHIKIFLLYTNYLKKSQKFKNNYLKTIFLLLLAMVVNFPIGKIMILIGYSMPLTLDTHQGIKKSWIFEQVMTINLKKIFMKITNMRIQLEKLLKKPLHNHIANCLMECSNKLTTVISIMININ